MSSREIVPLGRADDGSALQSLLDRSVIYERTGSVIPWGLLRFGFCGAGVIVLTGLLALILPGSLEIRHGGFFLLFGGQAAALADFLRGLVVLC
jgi:hypothetical protein